jgi:DNA repair protein RadC
MAASPSRPIDTITDAAAAAAPSAMAEATIVVFPAVDDAALRVRGLAARFGVDVLQDVEILQLHLAPPDQAASLALAQALIARFGGLAGVLAADRMALRRHVGDDTILNLKLLREATSRVCLSALAARPLLSSYGAVSDYLRAQMRGLAHEEFWVLFLDKRNQLLEVERHSKGTVDHAPVYPREVMKRALERGASALIIAHNHPAGDPQPSRPDIDMTKKIVEAGRALGIAVHDHLIIGSEKVESFKMLGLI